MPINYNRYFRGDYAKDSVNQGDTSPFHIDLRFRQECPVWILTIRGREMAVCPSLATCEEALVKFLEATTEERELCTN